jgi:GTPase SAR1 family protein
VLLFFDLTDRASFEALDSWFGLIAENTRAMPRVIVLGNKCDLANRETPIEEAQEYCARRKAGYFDISAKLGTNAEIALNSVVLDVVERERPSVQMPVMMDLAAPARPAERGCAC